MVMPGICGIIETIISWRIEIPGVSQGVLFFNDLDRFGEVDQGMV